MPATRRIALALPLGVPHLEEVVHGIHAYGQEHAEWDFVTSPETHSIPVGSLAGWDGDGVIGMVSAPADLGVVKGLACPVVNLSGAIPDPGLPRVRVDYERAGELAAEHLLNRGFERFAFYGLKDTFFARSCLEGFRSRVERHGARCRVYEDAATFVDNDIGRAVGGSISESLASPHRLAGVLDSDFKGLRGGCRRHCYQPREGCNKKG